jgi:hypothetical protein
VRADGAPKGAYFRRWVGAVTSIVGQSRTARVLGIIWVLQVGYLGDKHGLN